MWEILNENGQTVMSYLISVIMPCYNSVQSLPMALASLVAQTYEHWECIFVDDGSTDNPYEVIKTFNDERIRYFRFKTNQGRAIARQKALDEAKGDFLAMLDADDWYYPDKLCHQLQAIKEKPEAIVVASGITVVDNYNNIKGIRLPRNCRNLTQLCGPVRKLAIPPFEHGPSLIKMKVAKTVKFVSNFKRTQDTDFMLKVVLGSYYIVVPFPYYVYSELYSINKEKILESLNFTEQMFKQYLTTYPIASRKRIAITRVKSYIYRILYRLKLSEWIIEHRCSRQPNLEESRVFHEAKRTVISKLNKYLTL